MPNTMDQALILQIIKNNLPVGYSVVNTEGIIIDFNKEAAEITGYRQDEVLGKPHSELLHGTTNTHACPVYENTFEKRQGTVASETKIIRKDGREIDVLVTTVPLIDEQGVFLGGVGLFRDITQANKLKRERANMLSMFAHDMKNPIVSSAGFIERILQGKTGKINDKQRQYLEVVSDNLKNQEELIDGFLVFSRLEQKECAPQYTHFDLATLVGTVLRNLEIEREKKEILLTFNQKPGETCPVSADILMIQRVISNLIENAIRYCDTHEKINVSILREKNGTTLEVADDGPGISEEHIPHIFEPFHRGVHDTKGSGLGLAIAKSILECHNGKISFKNSPGRGAVFSVTLPNPAQGLK